MPKKSSEELTEESWRIASPIGTGVFHLKRGGILVPNMTYADCVQRGEKDGVRFVWIPHSQLSEKGVVGWLGRLGYVFEK